MGDILIQSTLFGLAAAVYALLAGHFWRTRWQAEPVAAGAPVASVQPWERAGIAAALMLHLAALYGSMFDDGRMVFSFALALSLVLWLATGLLWAENFKTRLESLQPFILICATLGAIAPLMLPRTHAVGAADLESFHFHLLAAMAAYGLFTVAAVQALFMRIAERRLHAHTLSRGISRLPPLLAMERLLFRTVAVAFGLLTIALISGALYSTEVHGTALRADHKTIFGVVSWLLFAGLLIGRHRFGWRGKLATRWLLAGFAVLVLAYLGTRFVVEILLGR